MIAVLSSFPEPRPTTNPYISQLAHALRETEEVDLTTFTWWAGLTHRYDVFHTHWPEILVGGQRGLKKSARQVLFVLLMLRFRLEGTAIVRTVHNLHLPAGISPVERVLLKWLDRRTDHRVVINSSTELPPDQPNSMILHGHYRDWFAMQPKRTPVPGRLAFVGLIRPYKGIDGLIKAFRALTDPDLSLRISGKPSSEELMTELSTLADSDARIRLRFTYLDDADLVGVTTEAELVILPYRHMHNSGAALMALSLDRPVLVPANEVNRKLSEEVGPGWMHMFEGDLDPEDLRRALSSVRSNGMQRRGRRPDLGARDWNQVGAAHAEVYRQACASVRQPGAAPVPPRRSAPGAAR